MSGLTPARKAALHALVHAHERDGYIRDIMRASAEVERLDSRDRALCYRLAVGTTAAVPVLDQVIDAHLARPGKTSPRLRIALRMAAFEICYLATPARAAVSQGVEAARSQARSAAGLANAVLRRIQDEDAQRVQFARQAVERALTGSGEVDAGDLSLVSGLPLWLASTLLDELGPTRAAAMCAAQLTPAPSTVQANPFVVGDSEVQALLDRHGLSGKPAALPGSFTLDGSAGLGASGLVDDVALVPADLAAQMVCAAVAPGHDAHMIEVGQGRATKSILISAAAHRAGATLSIDAVELHEGRTAIAQERLARANVTDVVSHAMDARQLADSTTLGGMDADVVFVDAPCSGSGTMRRHPEIASTLVPEAIGATAPEGLPALQLQILTAAATRVCGGGALMYSTCSVVGAENQGVVDAFLGSEAGSSFEAVALDDAPGMASLPAPARDFVLAHKNGHGHLATVPCEGGPDGHFLCCLVRR